MIVCVKVVLNRPVLIVKFKIRDATASRTRWLINRELTNRRLWHDGAVRLRDMLTAHAFLRTCQLRAKVDDVGESDLPPSWKQEDVMLVFKVFSRCFGYFCRII